MTTCPLCRLYEKREIFTKLFYEDDVCIVVEHSKYLTPMIVLKRHTDKPTPKELAHINQVAEKLFPDKHFSGPHSIRDHYHVHGV